MKHKNLILLATLFSAGLMLTTSQTALADTTTSANQTTANNSSNSNTNNSTSNTDNKEQTNSSSTDSSQTKNENQNQALRPEHSPHVVLSSLQGVLKDFPGDDRTH